MASMPPAGLAVQRDGSSLTKSRSDPSLLRTASGLPARSMLGTSTMVQVPAVSQCLEKRHGSTVGYRGFIPGKRAETVFGTTHTQGTFDSQSIRPYYEGRNVNHSRTLGRSIFEEWNVPDDHPRRGNYKRNTRDVMEWTRRQEKPSSSGIPGYGTRRHLDGEAYCEGEHRPLDMGPGIPGYSGHRNFATRQGADVSAEPSRVGPRGIELDATMSTDRECHPWDVHRPKMPGYTGHIRLRSVS